MTEFKTSPDPELVDLDDRRRGARLAAGIVTLYAHRLQLTPRATGRPAESSGAVIRFGRAAADSGNPGQDAG